MAFIPECLTIIIFWIKRILYIGLEVVRQLSGRHSSVKKRSDGYV